MPNVENGPETNVVSIQSHPNFRAKEVPKADDANQERKAYLEYMESKGSAGPDPFEQLQEGGTSTPEFGGSGPRAMSICSSCEHRRDLRPWYRRFLQDPKLKDLFCAALPRLPVLEPVTGTKGYLPTGTKIPANAQSEPFEHCFSINAFGTCLRFKPKLWYR